MYHLTLVILDNITSKNESEEQIVTAAEGMERDIKDLLEYAQTSSFILLFNH